MSKRSLPEQQRRDALDAMRKSAAESEDGVPCWGAIARQPGMPSRPTLKRWWQEEQEGRQAARASNVVQFPPSGAPSEGLSADVTTWSAVEFWVWRWRQVQAKIDLFESDVALVNGWKYQDEVWRQLRVALDADRKKTGVSPAEVATRLREMAAKVAPVHAEVIMAEFRRRKLA